MKKSKELVLPRNVPAENFQSNLYLYTERKHENKCRCNKTGLCLVLSIFLTSSVILTSLLIVHMMTSDTNPGEFVVSYILMEGQIRVDDLAILTIFHFS